ncbi:MAG: hypothetical protein HY912_24925 [Desulfomonile tiedjei]|uniref:Uncharacterized protein n=1 Tax=Desulfomonile tiedjei TaxID=2358 RepID=A0A9D6V8M8_9BACT|nr:hypothetical protein [Desulfomonile tiedjei]
MSETAQILLGFIFLIGCFVLTRYIVTWQIKRATGLIIRDLEKQEAFDPLTAVDLPYTKQNPLRMGMRNYYAKSMEYMVNEGVVGKTGSGKYYLRVRRTEEHRPELQES